ncbi:MAG: T9SS type A sorting domain-containing protein [Bacteroidota bacterium]
MLNMINLRHHNFGFGLAIVLNSWLSPLTAQVSQQWVSQFNHPTQIPLTGEEPARSFCDNTGNIIIGGNDGRNIFLMKTDSSGTILWKSTYNGSSNSNGDYLDDMVVDSNGYIYFTGKAQTIAGAMDIVVAKYDPSGNPVWLRTHLLLTGNNSDRGKAIYVDQNGNVFVTGFMTGSSGTDMATLKYDTNGNLLWSVTYTYPGIETGNDICNDLLGNVYVAGTIGNTGILISYDPMGNLRWSRNTGAAFSVACIDTNTIIVSGDTAVNTTDVYIKRLDHNGNVLWTDFYPGNGTDVDNFHSMAVSPSGGINILLRNSTSSNNPLGLTVIRYDFNGGQQWVAINNNPSDYPYSLALDANYDAIVAARTIISGTDWDYVTKKYNGISGSMLWSQPFTFSPNYSDIPTSLAIDNTNHIYTLGIALPATGDLDLGIIKYTSAGTMMWNQTYGDVLNKADILNDAVSDSIGNIYITGHCFLTSSSFQSDILTLKYDSSGILQWYRTFGSPYNTIEKGNAITLDPNGNCYVTGTNKTDSLGTGYDMVILKYDPSGTLLWSQNFSGPQNFADKGSDIVCDQAGNAYVAGSSYYSSLAASDFILLKYGPSGNLIWLDTISSSGNYNDEALLVELDSAGNIYTAGFITTLSTDRDLILCKYDSSGNVLFTTTFTATGSSSEIPTDILVTANGTAYISGTYAFSGDMLTMKINSLGSVQWFRTFSGSGFYDYAWGIAADSSENVYVTGMLSDGTLSDLATLKYDSAGNTEWSNVFSLGNTNESGRDIFYYQGKVFVTGSCVRPGSNQDFVTLIYDTGGNYIDTLFFDDGFNTNEAASRILSTGDGSCYVCGTGNVDDGSDVFVLRYSLCNNPVTAQSIISGPTTICTGPNNYTYSVSAIPNAAYYSWTVPSGATILFGQGTSSITVNFSIPTVGIISVLAGNGCSAGSLSDTVVNVNLCVGQNEPSMGIENTIVYPNPVDNGTLTIQAESEIKWVTMYNSIGARLLDFQTGFLKAEVDISTYPAGIYFLKVTLESGQQTVEKIVKN